MRYVLTVSYDGTDFCGWQRQTNGRSVQGELESALFLILNKEASVTGSGRTDAGVHAKGQVAHVDTDAVFPAERLAPALNTKLPPDVRVIESSLAKDGFHARYSAKEKTYAYTFYTSPVPLPLRERYAVRVDGFDVARAREICPLLEGEHDFRAFSKTGSSVKTTTRTVESVSLDTDGDAVTVRVTGNGFLYGMVRFIAGALYAYSAGKVKKEEIVKMLAGGDRPTAVTELPAKGLTLESVVYGEEKA